MRMTKNGLLLQMGNKNKSSHQNARINPYEKERMKILETNAARMKAKGFNKTLVNKVLQEKYDQVSKNVVGELYLSEEAIDSQLEVPTNTNCSKGNKKWQPLLQTLPMAEFYNLKARERQQRSKEGQGHQENQKSQQGHQDQEQHENLCQFEEDMNNQLEVPKSTNSSKGKRERQPLVQTLPMAEFYNLKARERQQRSKEGQGHQENKKTQQGHQDHEDQEQHENQESQQGHEAQSLSEQDLNQQKQHQQPYRSLNQQKNQKSYCAPGSMSRYAKMIKRQSSREQRTNELNDIGQEDDSPLLDDVDILEDGEDIQNEVANTSNVLPGSEDAGITVPQVKKHRGRTILAEVHGRTMDDRDPIILNDMRQPIGPAKDIVQKFLLLLVMLLFDVDYEECASIVYF